MIGAALSFLQAGKAAKADTAVFLQRAKAEVDLMEHSIKYGLGPSFLDLPQLGWPELKPQAVFGVPLDRIYRLLSGGSAIDLYFQGPIGEVELVPVRWQPTSIPVVPRRPRHA